MVINERLSTNPELIKANIIVGNALEKLLSRKWGSVTITFSLQQGRITTVKVDDQAIHQLLKDESIDNT